MIAYVLASAAVTLTQLRTFLAVADTGSVRAAAERLFVSQPAVSAGVSALEKDLGVALLARHGRGLRLTDAGRQFADAVRACLGLLDHAIRSASSADAPESGVVQVMAVTTAAERLLPPLLARFRGVHPRVGLSVRVGNRMTVWQALRDHDADLVIAGRPPAAVPARVLGRAPNRLVLIGPPEPAKRSRPAGAAADARALADQTWLLREAGSGTRTAADELIEALGITPATMILGSNGAVEQAVAAGLGVGLVSLDAVADRIADGAVVVRPCPGTPVERPWHLVAHASAPLTPTATLLAASMLGAGGPFRATPEGRRLSPR